MINLKEKLTAIADKFRLVLGTQDLIYPDEFVNKIDDVYEKSTLDFWDAVQNFGKRRNYEYGFSNWDSEYIRPRYKVVPTARMIHMFSYNYALKNVEKEYFDLSQCQVSDTGSTSGNYNTFYGCSSLEIIEDIGMQAGYYYATFRDCTNLKTIEVLRVNEATPFVNTFNGCGNLINIAIVGTIGQHFDIQYSPLSKESITSIVTHLSDTAEGKTLTMSQAAVDNAFSEEEWTTLVGTKTNWTISLV